MEQILEKPCTKCGTVRLLADFHVYAKGVHGRRAACKFCVSDWHKVHRQKPGVKSRRAECARLAYALDIESGRFSVRQRHAKLRADVLAHYGNVCTCCGESEKAFLHLDHINNDGNACRRTGPRGPAFYRWLRRNNYPDTLPLQILCANCNWGKHLNGGTCPHKQPKHQLRLVV